MSASKVRKGWGALILSSAFSVVAVVTIPRSDSSEDNEPRSEGRRPSARPAVKESAAKVETAEIAEGAEDTAEVAIPEVEASPSATKKAPAQRTTVNDPEQALKGEFSAAASSVDSVALADRLVAIGPGAAPTILRGLCGHLDLEALDEAGTGATADVRDRALRDAWARYTPAIRLAAIADAAARADTDGARVLIGLAGETGDAAAVPLVLELAGKLDPIQLARPYVVEPIERALITCLPAALESRAVADQLTALRGPLSEIVARSAVLCGSPLAQEIAFAHLGRSTATDLALLVTLTTPGLDTRRTLHGPQLDQLRTLVSSRSPEIRRAACVALGHARDGGSVEELVVCLDDIEPLVASAARTSLRAITGKDKGASTEEWQEWLEERTNWLQQVAPGIVETIRGEDYEQVVSGVDRLFERADARQEWTELCTDLLDSDSPRVVRRATEALLQTGTADALLAIEQARARLSGPRLRMLEAALSTAQ